LSLVLDRFIFRAFAKLDVVVGILAIPLESGEIGLDVEVAIWRFILSIAR
jgi:hypothetical protein